MSVRLDGNALGRTLAFMGGDLRDWPEQCINCGSADLVELYGHRERKYCEACRHVLTSEVLYRNRVARARREMT